MHLKVKASEWTPKRALLPKVEVPRELCQAIWNEIDRISTQLIANPVHSGKMRVQDNHYDVVRPRDCDPEKLLYATKRF
jgi:hypothetical protein